MRVTKQQQEDGKKDRRTTTLGWYLALFCRKLSNPLDNDLELMRKRGTKIEPEGDWYIYIKMVGLANMYAAGLGEWNAASWFVHHQEGDREE